MDYDKIVFKTFTTPYTGRTTDIIYGIEKALKDGKAVRIVCTYSNHHFVTEELVKQRRKETVSEYMDHIRYIYGDAIQAVTNEDDMQEYYRLAWSGGVFPRRYRISWDTLEGHRYREHTMNGLIEARNKKHARDIFRVWWNASEDGRRPHPRHAFHVTVECEER